MRFTRMLLIVIAGMLLASPALLATEPAELADPRWWFRQSEAALKQVKDPEAHTLIKQVVGQMQGAALSPVQAQTAVDEQLATLRTQLPPEEEWRYQYLAAQIHGAAHQYPAALQALTNGRGLAAARFTDKPLKNIVETFDQQLGNQANAAARHGDVEIAIELVSAMEDAKTRDRERASLSRTLATHKQLKHALEVATTIEDTRAQEETFANLVHIAVEHEPAAVEQVLERMTPAAAEQARRIYWIRACRTGERKAWERAIEGVLSFADPILLQKLERRSAGDLEGCLIALNHQFESSQTKVPMDDALGKRFLALLEHYCERKYVAGEAAGRCRVSYLIATEQFEAALNLERDYRNERTLASTQLQIARRYLRLKQPEKALALCREIRGQEPSFELINAFRSAGELAAALELAATIDELRFSAVPLNDIARDYDKINDQAGVQRAVAALAVDDLRAICLATLAQQAIADKRNTQADQYLIAAEKLLTKLPHDQFRGPAANAVSAAYAQRGDLKAVARLVEAYGDGADRAAQFLSVAYQRCEAKDLAGCKAALVAFETHLTPEKLKPRKSFLVTSDQRRRTPLNDPANSPPAPTTDPYDSATPQKPVTATLDQETLSSLMQLSLFGAQLYCRQGDTDAAQKLVQRAFAQSEEVGGTFWRVEMYLGMFQEMKTPEQMRDLAALAEVLPVTDKAIVMAIGGALVAHVK